MSRGPPQLMFDDGSRVMAEDSEKAAMILDQSSSASPTQRGSIPLHTYYEIDRMSKEVIELMENNKHNSNPMWRVALQFPDELLEDSPEVCWLLEDKIRQDLDNIEITPFCFVLGDTTVNSCCPDEVAAHHLNADVLIHYGHACLSPTETLPVLYSFGKLELDVDAAVDKLETTRNDSSNNFLILYQVGYHHAMADLKEQWKQRNESLNVVVAEIPRQKPQSIMMTPTSSCCEQPDESTQSGGCCGGMLAMPESDCGDATLSSSCCQQQEQQVDSSCNAPIASSSAAPANATDQTDSDNNNTDNKLKPLVVGGLELPADQISSWEDLANYTVVFIMANPDEDADNYSMDDNTTPQQRQYANSMLCFLSLPQGEPGGGYWIYSPTHQELRTDVSPSPALKRQLKRRFFLTQKAKDANVFGILVSNLSQQHLVDVVKSLQTLIQDSNRTAYSFAVGKINPAKLANFAEIETFVIVACREHSLLDNEREYPIPVITPMELEIALDHKQWGMQAYSLDCQDVMMRQNIESDQDSVESDAPYFSMVTGKYESRKQKGSNDMDLQALPGKGQVTEYKSEAANFLRQREYQGLESKMGQTEVKTAVQGMRGIASDYRADNEEQS